MLPKYLRCKLVYMRYDIVARDIVGQRLKIFLCQLLGHGSGKMFYKKADGSFNFEADSVKSALQEDEPVCM